MEWKDQAGLVPFNRIDVFDSRATLLHVDGDLNYVYTPGELARFPLGAARDRRCAAAVWTMTLRQELRRPIRFWYSSTGRVRIYPLVDSMGAATDLGQLEELAVVADAEKQEIETLKTEIDALRTTNPAAQLKLAETVKQHLDALKKAFSAVGRFDMPKYGEES